jgi:hypothetical protein
MDIYQLCNEAKQDTVQKFNASQVDLICCAASPKR